MKKRIACLAALLALGAAAAEKPAVEGAAPGKWTMDLEAAQKLAAAKKLPLMLTFTGSDWCGLCQQMEAEVFSKDAWGAYAKDNLLLVWLDFPQNKALVPEKFTARNKALAERYAIEGFPAYILLDDDGKTVLGRLSADPEPSPEKFIADVKAALQNRASATEALLKTLPAKAAQEYRAAVQKRSAAETELDALKKSFKQKSEELTTTIAAQEKTVADIRLEARLAKLPKDKADAYRTKNARLAAVNAELKAWLDTNPDRTEANTTKFNVWQEEIAALKRELANVPEK